MVLLQNTFLNTCVRAAEVTVSKVLLHKREEPSSDPQHPFRSQAWLYSPVPGNRTSRSLGLADQPVQLDQWDSVSEN